jgi:threonine dehydratase
MSSAPANESSGKAGFAFDLGGTTISPDDIKAAAATLRGSIIVTDCSRSRTLSEICGCNLWLKFENLQFTSTFKERGALNRLSALSVDERCRGVIAMSAGNHAQGVAYHAKRLGIPATIVMPVLEMLEAVPQLQTLIVPIGGGGLISGMAIAAKAINPDIRIIGVQARLYPSMYNVVKGEDLPIRGDTLAEGIAVKAPGQITRDIIRRLVDDIVLVSDDQIERAVAMLISVEKTVAEGAGAAGLAAVLAAPERFQGENVGLILTGGNIDTRLIASVLTRDLAREGRLTQLSIDIVDRPGQLALVCNLLAEAGANVIEVSHQRTFSDLPAKATLLQLVIETRDRLHLEDVLAQLAARGLAARI